MNEMCNQLREISYRHGNTEELHRFMELLDEMKLEVDYVRELHDEMRNKLSQASSALEGLLVWTTPSRIVSCGVLAVALCGIGYGISKNLMPKINPHVVSGCFSALVPLGSIIYHKIVVSSLSLMSHNFELFQIFKELIYRYLEFLFHYVFISVFLINNVIFG